MSRILTHCRNQLRFVVIITFQHWSTIGTEHSADVLVLFDRVIRILLVAPLLQWNSSAYSSAGKIGRLVAIMSFMNYLSELKIPLVVIWYIFASDNPAGCALWLQVDVPREFGVLLLLWHPPHIRWIIPYGATMCIITVFPISLLCYVVSDFDSPFSGFFRKDVSCLLLVVQRAHAQFLRAKQGNNEMVKYPWELWLFCFVRAHVVK